MRQLQERGHERWDASGLMNLLGEPSTIIYCVFLYILLLSKAFPSHAKEV